MNNQMPNGFIPQYNMKPNNEFRIIADRIEFLEKRITKLEKKASMSEGNPTYQMTNDNITIEKYPNNYMI